MKDSETDTVLEIMNKEHKSRTRGQSRFGMANQLAEPGAPLQNNTTFDWNQGFGEGSYMSEKRQVRSPRAKKADRMVISMTLNSST